MSDFRWRSTKVRGGGLLPIRRCNCCGKEKTLRSFHKDKNKAAGRDYTCKLCRKHKQKLSISNLSDGYVAAILTEGTDLYVSDIPKTLIESKRLFMQINRELKNEKYN